MTKILEIFFYNGIIVVFIKIIELVMTFLLCY